MKKRYTVFANKRRRAIRASKDYATLRGMDFEKAKDILTKDGFYEHEYGDKDNNNGYAVYRKGDKEVELQYRWVAGKRKGDAHAGKVTNVYVDDNIYGATNGRSVLASAQWDEYTVVANGKNLGTDKAGSFELAARGVMSWFSYGTIITVSNSRGETRSYEIIKVDDSVRGYSDLRDVTDRLDDAYASTRLPQRRVMASNYNPNGFAVTGYYDSNYRGAAADRYFDPNELDEAAFYAHDLLSKGLYVNIIYWGTGDKVDITPDEYFDNFDGDFWCTRDLVDWRDEVYEYMGI